jgi:hypothetical protein
MVIPTLTTLGVKRKLDGPTPELQSHKEKKAVDIWIYVEQSQPWDIRGIGRL